MIREILEIDEALCDGCGACVPSCAEGALAVVDGRLRLLDDALCDGLGACLGNCPRGALRVVRREATAFDEALAHARPGAGEPGATVHPPPPRGLAASLPEPHGCPGSRPRSIDPAAVRRGLAVVPDAPAPGPAAQGGSALRHWPVQLALVSPHAPDLRDADLLVAADCAPFAYARFHDELLAGRRLVVACPKLDDLAAHAAKLAEIFRRARPRSVQVVRMEVPCCGGLVQAARQAAAAAGLAVPIDVITIGIAGERLG